MQNKIKATFIVIFFSLCFSNLSAQDLQVEVIINDENLPIEFRERLVNFKQNVENYLNGNKWHEKSIPPIRATFNFNFRSASGIDRYDAQLFVIAQREVYRQDKREPVSYTTTFKFLDDRVAFNYNQNVQFIKNDVIFDSFLSLLDYYAYVVVGFDEDSYFPRGGNVYFQKALQICNKPKTDNRGWTETGGGSRPSRLQLMQELLNPRFDDFRRGFFEYHWMGLDSLGINRTNAYNNILRAITRISNIKRTEVRAFNPDIFFDEKAEEIGMIFLDYGDRSIYNRLAELDPAHQRIYEEFRDRR